MRHYRLASGEAVGVAKSSSVRNGGASRRNGSDAAQIDLGPLPNLLGYVMRRAQLALYQDFFQTFAKLKIRPAQLAVLTVIERNPGLKQSEIAASLGIKRTNFVVLAHSLERRGLVERRPSAHDRRSNALYITEDGRSLGRRGRQLVEAHESRLVARLGADEFARLLALLHRIAGIGAGEPRVSSETVSQPRQAGSPVP